MELWRDQFVDALVGRSSWVVVLIHEPLSSRYRLSRSWQPERVEWYASLDSAQAALEVWYLSPLVLLNPASGSYYYDARLEVEALTVSDLEELERWLRGELAPAIRSGRGGGLPGAIARGAREVFVRLVGFSTRRYEARSPRFRP